MGLNLGIYEEFIDSSSALGGSLHLGFDMTKYLSLETNLGYVSDSEEDLDLSVSHGSLYLRGNWRFEEHTLFVLAGETYTKTDFKAPNPFGGTIEGDEEETDFSYGIGMDFFANPNTGVTLKWVRVIDVQEDADSSGGHLDAWFVGFTHYLGRDDYRRF